MRPTTHTSPLRAPALLPSLFTALSALPLVCSPEAHAQGCTAPLLPTTSLASGIRPTFTQAFDLNHDSRTDLVVLDQQGMSLEVFVQTPGGTFEPHQTIALPAAALSFEVGDVTGEGFPDIVVATSSPNAVTIYSNLGTADFIEERTLSVGSRTYTLRLADADADNDLDIFGLADADGTIKFWENQGTGGYDAPKLLATLTDPRAMTTADLDHSGRPDIIASDTDPATGTPRLVVFIDPEPTGATPTRSIPLEASVTRLDTADHNADSHPDIAALSSFTGSVLLLLGDGTGSPQPTDTVPAGVNPSELAFRDLDGDTFPELITASWAEGTITTRANQAGTGFGPPRSFPVAPNLSSITVAPLSSDTIPDLITTSDNTRLVYLLTGQAGGSFSPADRIPTGAQATGITIADMNRDGLPDLVSTGWGTGEAHFHLNLGPSSDPEGNQSKARFTGFNAYATGNALTQQITSADLNRDSLPDVISANGLNATTNAGFSVLLNQGEGVLAPAAWYPLGTGTDTRPITISDINRDGAPDLLIPIANGSVRTYLNQGDGAFTFSQHITTGTTIALLALADIDADGDQDLVLPSDEGTGISLSLNDGAGTFSQPMHIADAGRVTSCSFADIDQDGDPDLVYTDQTGIVIRRNDGTVDGQPSFSFLLGRSPEPTIAFSGLQHVVTDVTGDAIPDLVVTRDTAPDLYIWKGTAGTGESSFETEPAVLPLDGLPTILRAADLDADGDTDIVALTEGHTDATVLLNNSSETNPLEHHEGLDLSGSARGLALADLDADGYPELVASSRLNRGVVVVRNEGPSEAHPLFAPHHRQPLIEHPDAIRLGDLNQDGTPDIVTRTPTLNRLEVLLSDPLNTKGTSPSGRTRTAPVPTFAPPALYPTGEEPSDTAIADINADAAPDLIVTNLEDNTIGIYLNAGTGELAPPSFFPAGISPNRVVTADLNRDSLPDIVVANTYADSVSVLLTTPAGSPGPFRGFDPFITPHAIAAGDLNRDGFTDIVCADTDSGLISVLYATNDGTLTDPVLLHTGSAPTELIVQDLNQDRYPDIAFISTSRDELGVFINTREGDFSDAKRSPVGPSPRGIASADLDGDANPDLVVANFDSSDLSVVYSHCAADAPCNPADLAQPFGTLNISDVLRYLTRFSTDHPEADIVPPYGIFNVDDVLAFLEAFQQGCP